MAISFNFDTKNIPVKENKHKCIDCLRFHKCSNNIGICGNNLDFIFNDNKVNCKYYLSCKENHNRQIYFSFCFYTVFNNNIHITDSGVGLVLETAKSDYDILKSLKDNKSIMNNAANKVKISLNFNNLVIFPVLIAERYYNDKDFGTTIWTKVCYKFAESDTIIQNLNNEK